MYAAPAEPAEALESSAQWLAAALAATLIAPNVITAVTTAIAISRPGTAWMIDAMYAWAAAAYAVVAVLIVFLAALFGRRLSNERRRLLVGASASAAVVSVVGAAWRFASGPLPPLILSLRNASELFVYFAVGRVVAQICATGFRRSLGNVTAILACVGAVVGVEGLLGVQVPARGVLWGIADVGAWVGAVIALAVLPRRLS